MTLFSFDSAGSSLDLVPLAARRALDHAGAKLPLAGWRSLGLEARRELCSLGAATSVDVERVRAVCAAADPAASPVVAVADPAADVPPSLVEAYRSCGALSQAVWLQLTPLARYALTKVAHGAPERVAAAYAEIVGHSQVSTHLAPQGGVRMVDIAAKADTRRRAEAESRVSMSAAAFDLLAANAVPKGDVLGSARLAGIMAAKRTSELIPLCHLLALTHVGLELTLEPERRSVHVLARAETVGKTGVEMEALVAASIAALTIYDMLKAVDRSMQIGPTRLVSKSGGASGDFRHDTPVRDS